MTGPRFIPRVVFLDIDGVLTSAPFFKAKTPDIRFSICPQLTAKVQTLCERANAAVVVSSTWRVLHKMPDLRRMLKTRGLTNPIIGRTPELHRERGYEIQAWLHESGQNVEGFVILDDDSDMVHLSPWHVKTSFDTGLTDADVERALKIIARPVPAELRNSTLSVGKERTK